MEWSQILIILGSNILLMVVMFSIHTGMYLHTARKIESIEDELRNIQLRFIGLEERNNK